MKKLFLMSLVLMGLSLSALAQGPRGPKALKHHTSAEELMKQKWEHIVKGTGMDEKLAETIQPIFENYENSLLSLQRSKQEVNRSIKKMEKPTEEDYKMLNAKTLEFELEKSRLYAEYFEQLNGKLKPSELTKYINAERNFKRELFGPRQGMKGPQPPTGAPAICPNK